MKKFVISYIKMILLLLVCFSVFSLKEKQASASADNSLSMLSIEGIRLEPEFKYSRLKYSGSVDYSVTDVQVNAVTSNKAAKIVSISGNSNLQVGENEINIVVQAKNGRKATYTILLTRRNASDIDSAQELSTSATTDEAKPKQTETEKLKSKIKKKNKKLDELNRAIEELNTTIQETEGKYQNIMKENQKIYSQRVIMIIIIVLLFCSLILSLFIGAIKRSTGKYVDHEFGEGGIPEEIPKKRPLSSVRAKNIAKEKHSDDEEYGFMKRVSENKESDSLFSSIEEVIQSELHHQNKEVEDVVTGVKLELPEEDGLNTAESSMDFFEDDLNQEIPPSTDTDEEKKDDFSFDIIEI